MGGGIAPNPPTPTALKVLRGNPGKRAINKNEPHPKIGLPSPPKHLKNFPLAIYNWRKEGGLLLKLGVMTEADWGVLAIRCYLYSQMVEIMESLRKEGRVIEKVWSTKRTETREIKTNPLVSQLETIIAEYRRVGVLLGLDPSSRSRIKVTKSLEKGEFDEFF